MNKKLLSLSLSLFVASIATSQLNAAELNAGQRARLEDCTNSRLTYHFIRPGGGGSVMPRAIALNMIVDQAGVVDMEPFELNWRVDFSLLRAPRATLLNDQFLEAIRGPYAPIFFINPGNLEAFNALIAELRAEVAEEVRPASPRRSRSGSPSRRPLPRA